ncbi:HEPN domain-containing protein [Candidatus Micrarchaeota archaeon]|nr:HEPN domain-containing protein [Candidatus Micrarchaeota archaeon]
MNLAELLKKDLVRKVESDREKAKEILLMAERDLRVASDNLKNKNYDWALAIAYNAMLSAGRALMTYKGYMPVSEAHHLAVVQFCAAVFPAESIGLANTFNRYRVRRHDVVYGESDSVGKEEAEKALENAKKFVELVKERL